ncbi:MAG: c-type cytochrome [Woeseiaceae bacterium]
MNATFRPRLIASTIIFFVVSTVTNAAADETIGDGSQIYATNCAVCHGQTGAPDADSPVVEGLGVMPADFSDPLFNSREPASDWEMVIKHGGHALGLAEQMPAQGTALGDAEISAVTAYLKGMVDTREYPPGEMNLMLPTRVKKAFPEDEVVYKGRFTNQDGEDHYKNVVEFEKRVGKRGQAIVELVHESQGSASELSEAEIGYKHVLSSSKRHILSGAAVYAIPVEASGDGELQTYLAYGTEVSPAWTLQSSLRLKFPAEKASNGEVELAGIVHYVHSPWPRRVFPALELTATQPFKSRNGDLEWTALPQVRIGLTRGGHVALNVGVELPLSDQTWDNRLYLTLLWDFADGGFLAGW